MYVDRIKPENLISGKAYVHCFLRTSRREGREYHQVPTMRQDLGMLSAAMSLEKPRILPGGKTVADSQRKLQCRRKSNK